MICNLQPTKQDRKADLNIHTYVDDVMRMVSSVSKYFSHLPNIFAPGDDQPRAGHTAVRQEPGPGAQVSCDWSTQGHVTTMITSDWPGWRWGSSPPTPRSCVWTGPRTPSWPGIELQTNLCNDFTITDLLWAFSWHLLAHSYLIHHAKKVLNTHG